MLAFVSSLGYLLLIPLSYASPTREISIFAVGHLMVAFCYLPALIVVLRRPDENSDATQRLPRSTPVESPAMGDQPFRTRADVSGADLGINTFVISSESSFRSHPSSR